MSVFGHVAAGVVLARAASRPASSDVRSGMRAPGATSTAARISAAGLAVRMLALPLLALLPDIDFLFVDLAAGVPALQHRAATHSLAAAAGVGMSIALVLAAIGDRGAFRHGVLAAAAVASHGLIDTLGTAEPGVQLFWPFSNARVHGPWALLPNPGIGSGGLGPFLSQLALELLVFLPAWVYAFFPRRWLPADI